ncbi:MAG: hypothetical protein Kow00109_16230 [Acidobacteriota bacterium]
MRKRLLILGVLAVVGAAAVRVWLKSYSVEIVNLVVMEAVISKAPEDYPKEKIAARFRDCLARQRTPERRKIYLERLQRISHLLEKAAALTSEEIDAVLRELSSDEAPC